MDVPHYYQPIFNQLRGVRSHRNFWHAFCPAHEDQKRSLSIRVGKLGQLLVKCHAGVGCSFKTIIQELNRKPEEFFPPRDERPKSKRKSNLNIVKAYDYRDERGQLVSQTVRLEPKEFRQRRPKPGGGWDWSLSGLEETSLVVYRLPELLKIPLEVPVYIVEGEKGADALCCRGLFATCSPMGAGKWKPHFSQWFIGRKVVVVPDDDPFSMRSGGDGESSVRYFPGFDHARTVALSLIGKAVAIRIARLYFDRQKKDPFDWFEVDKRTKQEFLDVVKSSPSMLTADDVESWFVKNTTDVDPAPPETLKSQSAAMAAADRLREAAGRMTVSEWVQYAHGVLDGLKLSGKE